MGTMPGNGLVKAMEECGEFIQIAAKKLAYPDTDEHPDGKGSMRERLEEETADVMAAMLFFADKMEFDVERLESRVDEKLEKYERWSLEDSEAGK